MTIRGTIRRVWMGSGRFTVIVSPLDRSERLVLKTTDPWLASLAERFEVYTGRPTVSVQYDEQTRELQGIALPVAQEA